MQRAYAVLDIKSIDDESRIIEGLATTPTADRSGDVVEPAGAQFQLPLPLLWQHDPHQPIGEVFAATVTPAGIQIRARLARIAEPGRLKDRLDEAWQSVKAVPPLVRGLSIGFTPLDFELIKGTTSRRFIKWLWAELSAVTIPMNLEATIQHVKSLDLAASGRNMPPVGGPLPPIRAIKVAHAMTIAEQVRQFEATRAAKAARMSELMTTAAAASVTLDAPQTEEYDDLEQEVRSVDAHLVRLHALETTQLAGATRIEPTNGTATASAVRGASPVITVKANVPPATAFIRYCQAKAFGAGDTMKSISFAEQWKDSTPEVAMILKAAVAPGTTTDATWAGPLVQLKPLAAEFLELLRPATVIGNIPNLHSVPFNVSVPSQTGGGTYQWVGQGAPKPVGKLTFATLTLGVTKCAGIIAITEELARLSSPSAEETIRRDMINGIAHFLDIEFTDPAKAPVANISPGSITNGVTPITSAGTTPANARTDLAAMVRALTVAGLSAKGAALLMSEANAAALGNALNPLGQPLFPSISAGGGSAMGLTVVTSSVLGNAVILLQPDAVFLADDGGVTIDVSREASVQMNDAPANPADATTVFTSFWQQNLIGLRAERFITWKVARAGAVQYTVSQYTG